METQDVNQKDTQQYVNGKELDKLHAFIGKWHAKGTSYADGQDRHDPYAAGVPWISDESYEWLPGNFFVVHTWTANAGERLFIGTEIIGYDEIDNQFFTHFFDNAGFHPTYKAIIEGNVWHFTEPNTQAKVTINDPDTITYHWEWKHEGSTWLPLCDRVAKRVR